MCTKFHGFMGQTKNKKPTKTTTEKNPTTIKKKKQQTTNKQKLYGNHLEILSFLFELMNHCMKIRYKCIYFHT